MGRDAAKREFECGRTRRRRAGRYAGALVGSLASHGAILMAALSLTPAPAPMLVPPPITEAIVAAPSLIAPPVRPAPQAAPTPAPPKPTPPKPAARRPTQRILAASRTRASPSARDTDLAAADSDGPPGLSDSELAGAATAGSGGGICDMARRLQDALRKDPLAQAAIARLGGKAVMVWNGDWVWMQGEDGKGLAAVRQAMMWEIAFSPKACQGETVHGLVVISPVGSHGSARLALGHGIWRWSDLLTPHPAPADQ
jgi:hypothetical protein